MRRLALAAALLALGAGAARAASVSWSGGVGGDWNVAGNWSGGAVPGPSDDVSIVGGASAIAYPPDPAPSVNSLTIGPGSSLLTYTGLTAAGAVTLMSGGGATLQLGATAPFTVGSLSLQAGSLLSYTGPAVTAGATPPVQITAALFSVGAGATVTVQGAGYAGGPAGGGPGYGPGAGGTGGAISAGGGGGHAGAGGAGGGGINAGTAYDAQPPSDGGSGGGGTPAADGGAGGGLLIVTASTAVVNGLVTADGADGVSLGQQGGGGGAGGGVVLTASVLRGAGTISARGGAGGTGANDGGGGGGGGFVRLVETDGWSVFHATLTVLTDGGGQGFGGLPGVNGSAGSAFVDPRHWTGGGPDSLASDPANWSAGLPPSGGEMVVFGASTTARRALWDLGSVAVGSMTIQASFSTSVVLSAGLDVTGSFEMAGGTVSAGSGLLLRVDGPLAQTGGRLDLFASSMTLAAAGASQAASFFDARTGALLVGGGGAATATVSGLLEVVGLAQLQAGGTLSLASGLVEFDGAGPFAGPGSVNAAPAAAIAAAGSSTQTWTTWPGALGSLRVMNRSSGGLVLASGTTFTLLGDVVVDTGAVLTGAGTRLEVGGNWAAYGLFAGFGSTVAFRGASGVQSVLAGASFDNLVVDDAGATLRLSTWVVVADSVSVLSGTFDLAASTLDVQGNWTENPGATTLGGTNVTIFDALHAQTIFQNGWSAFGVLRSSAAGGVIISSAAGTTSAFEWHRGNLNYSNAALTIGGDMLVKGGIILTPTGSTVVFNGASTQTVNFPLFGDILFANTSPAGVRLGAPFMTAGSVWAVPGAVIDGLSSNLTVGGSVWNTAGATYYANGPNHSVLWQPAGGSIAVGAGSVVNAKLALDTGKTAVLQGDLNITGAGTYFDPRIFSTVVNATGGSTIAFRGASTLQPSGGNNWTYGGDAANSWLVFEGSGSARGALISSNTYGTLRVTLNTNADVFQAPTLSLTGRLILESGTLKPSGIRNTLAVAGDVLQTGGVVDYSAASTGTLLLNGTASQTLALQSGANTWWNVVDVGTATVQLTSDLVARGDLVVTSGTFAAGSGSLLVHGRVHVSTAATFLGQSSTVTLNGAAIGASFQSLAFYGAGAFNGLAINVSSVSLLTSATAAVFADAVAGGTMTVAAGRQLTAADLRLGPAAGANLRVQSSVPGSPWWLAATSVSSATAVTASDSNATPGVPILANDGRSVDGGGNSNWIFSPILLVLLPGESLTLGVAPGKTGVPAPATAGAPLTVTVAAVSSRYTPAFAATGTVTLTSDDAYAQTSGPRSLVGGTTTLTFTPLVAEPAPRATRVFAATFWGSNVSTASVSPAGLARLQLIMAGEAAAPGSPTGRAGAPFPRVKGVAFGVTVRAVDPYWNLASTVTDSYLLGTTASSATLPVPPALAGGVGSASGLIMYSTGIFTLVATDVTEPAVLSSTSAPFGVVPPSTSSPTASFYIPTGAAIATLGGFIAGTAADMSAVERVRVDILEVETGFHFDANSQGFTAAAPIYTTTTLASPLAPGTSWSNPVPDAALAGGRHYSAVALVDDPSGFTSVAASTFVVDRTALSYGSRSGQGSAFVLPAFSTGCETVVATVTFTVGAAGIGRGGAVAVRAPEGWTPPAGTSSAFPPPPGFWRIASTSTVFGLGQATATMNPASFGGQTLGPGWTVLSVATTAAFSFQPGEAVTFTYAGLPPLSPAARAAQTFAVWSSADAGSPLAPVSTQPVVSLAPGTSSYLAFSDPAPLNLGPLQAAPTMQLKVVDLCGNDKPGVSSGTALLSLVVPVNGSYVPDAGAVFRTSTGGLTTSVFLSTGFALSPSFSVATATSGPSLAYIRASSTFISPSGQQVQSVALRPVRLAGSPEAFTAVSVDTGTLSPGTTSAALSPAAPDASLARIVFTLADPALTWDVALSSDVVGFSSPTFRATGSGGPAPVLLSWDGVDRVSNPPRRAPPGHYRVRLRAGGGTAYDASTEIVVPPTAGYFGTVGAAGAGATVRAVGPGAGDGAFAVASSSGYFQLSGLRPGQAYQLQLATAAAVSGIPVTLSTALAAAPASLPAADVGSVAFPAPARVRVAALLPVASPFDAVGGFVGRAADGSAAFGGALRFSTGSATSDDGGPLFGRAASTWSATLASPGVYTLELDVPDLRLSTAVAGVAVTAAGLDFSIPLDRRAGARGWAILPSTAAGGTTISVQATKAGDSSPSAFAAVFVSSVPPAVGPSSGAYALYGLDPGTWTVLASAPGCVGSSATIVVSGASDAAVPDLALGAGGRVTGGVFVNGDTLAAAQCAAGPGGGPAPCPSGVFDVTVEALARGTLDRAAVVVPMTASAASSTAAFTLSGLAPGVWTLRTSLPGFSLAPAGGALVSVTGTSVSTASLTLAAQDARLAATVTVPAPSGCLAAGAWASLGLSFQGADGVSRAFGDATALPGAGGSRTLYCSSATFTSPPLPPGTARAAAVWAPSGAWAFGRALLADGSTSTLSLDLTASSVPVSGALTVAGVVTVATRSAAGVPFTVAASSPSGILSAATGVSFCLLGSKDPVVRPSLRAELVPYDASAGTPPLRRAAGGAGSCAAMTATSGLATSLGFAAAVNPDGTFSFSPGLAPGLYLLRVPGELDDIAADGAEAVEYDQLVAVSTAGILLAPRLGRGARVSGWLTAPATLPAGRAFRVALLGAGGAEARGTVVAPPSGGSAFFSFDGVADGRYALTATDLSTPRAFAAAPVSLSVAGVDQGGFTLALVPAATVRARLAVARTRPDGTQEAVLITRDNAGLLPAGFAATATADPAAAGAVYVSRPAPDGSLVDAIGRIVVEGLAPGTYDVSFAAPSDPATLGRGSLALAPALVAGVTLAPGQAADLGVVALFEGSFVSGRVTDAATGAAAAGVRVAARPSDAGSAPGAAASDVSAVTDGSGRYVLRGLDPARRYDVTAAPRGPLVTGTPLPPYAAARSVGVDVSSGAALDFALTPAPGSIKGRVVSPSGSALTASLGPGDPAAPGAVVTLQTGAVPPSQDPLSDLALRTNADGTFTVPSVAPGTYRLTASALGSGSAALSVVVGAGAKDLGTVTLGGGASLSGAVRLPDGSAPSASEVRAIAAAAADSSDFQFAALTQDPSGGVTGYSVGGLTPGKTYRLVVTGPGGNGYVPPEAAAVVLASTSDARVADLTLRPPTAPPAFRAVRAGTRWAVSASFARPLRSRYAADSDPAVLLATAAAAGSLSGGALSADRMTVSAYYDPAPGETSAVFRASAALAATDWSASSPGAGTLAASATAALRLAGDGLTRATALNGLGATLTLDGDQGRLVLPRGAFAVDAASSVVVGLARSAAPSAFAASAPPAPLAGPLYDVSPVGAPSALARPAELTLAYSTSVADPSRLHVYWWNPGAGAYVLQPDALGLPLTVDRAARTVTLRVNHFSTYVLLDSAAGAIGGTAFAGGELEAYNFPNPFDLSVKTVTTIHGGGAPTIRGTLIRVSVPPGLAGAGTLRVFDVTGRLIRSIDLGQLSAGQIYYQAWDGRNDSGLDVASGLYLGQVEVGSHKKTFKMAVLK